MKSFEENLGAKFNFTSYMLTEFNRRGRKLVRIE